MAKEGEIKVGDKVTTNAETDCYGTHLASFVRERPHDVGQIDGDRVVIYYEGICVAAVDISTLTLVDSSGKKTNTKDTKYKEKKISSKAIEEGLTKLLDSAINEDKQEWSKYTTRLFGCPHQFQHYCDYRTFSSHDGKNGSLQKPVDVLMGRTFITNIMMEAPIVTFVPGKPLYLPASSEKQGVTRGLLEAANRDLSTLSTALKDETLHEKLRYYDFQQDYYSYMRYVNVLCSTAAAFLDLGGKKLDGVPLTRYDWKNYRWTANNYSTASGKLISAGGKALSGAVDTVKTLGSKVFSFITGKKEDSNNTTVTIYDDKGEEDTSFTEKLEQTLAQMNFVQFFVDASSGLSETAENSTDRSKFEDTMSAADEMSKELQFLMNSGGVDADKLTDTLNDGIDAMTEKLIGDDHKAFGGIMDRLMSGVTNVIQGETMIFPEIYQNSRYNKTYTIAVDLRTPYGNKYSYYMNILVPLFHIIAFTIPKQATANTYSSPFLVKAYYPGVFSCNLGIIQSIQIDKCPSGDSWTVDGFPSEVKVTITLVDLYSDLSITPAGDVVLFLANSSLIEYIATSCGINLVTPQLANRMNMVVNTIKNSLDTIIDDTVNMAIWDKVENRVASLVQI